MRILRIHVIIRKITQNPLISQMVRFYGVSVLSCIVNLGSRYLFNFIFTFVESIFLSSILGALANFILVKSHVFSSKGKLTQEMFLYALYQVFAIVFITAIAAGLDRFTVTCHIVFINQEITYVVIQIISLGINALVGFFYCKYIVFSESPPITVDGD